MREREYQVVYLTGAPASGKSSLLEALTLRDSSLTAFSYSRELARRVRSRDQKATTEEDLRRHSATVVLPEDVEAVDDLLVTVVREHRGKKHIVIDSHAVTKEAFGFRVTPFDIGRLKAISPTLIVCLYAHSGVVIDRIRRRPDGRPVPSPFEADLHVSLQGGVAIQYGILLGIPVYFLDTSRSPEYLVEQVLRWMSSRSG